MSGVGRLGILIIAHVVSWTLESQMTNSNPYFFTVLIAFRINAVNLPFKSHKTKLSFSAISCQSVISFSIMVLCLIVNSFKNNTIYTLVSIIVDNIYFH